jgi:polar amino acid transport system substrate-binding protein
MAMFVADKLEAAAGVRQPIVEFASRHPNVRVIAGRFMAIEQAMGVPNGRDTAVRYLRDFVEEMKALGFVADALKRNNKPDDALVAPPA